jgi:hypothetical protein
MFIEVQKLELFSEHKSPELEQYLNLSDLPPLIRSGLLTGTDSMQIFRPIQPLAADQPDLKVPILTLLETSPV